MLERLEISAREQLQETRSRLELAVEGAKLGTWTFDLKHGSVWYSDRSKEMYGLDRNTVVDARTLQPFVHPDDWNRVSEPYVLGFPTGKVEVEYRIVRPDGSIRWIYALGTPVRGEDGTAHTVNGIHIDITDRKLAEAELAKSREALHQSEKLAALGSLLAGVSHELNNPLAAIVGQAEMLQEDAAGTPLEQRARKISSAAARCARIVQTFLAMARHSDGRRGLVDLNELIGSALELTEYSLRTAGVSVRVNQGTGLPPVEADKDQVHQVLVNLIVNAQQAMEGIAAFERTLTIRTSSSAGAVILDISDTGPGVPPEMRTRIFDPFFTTKPQGVGTGIGLSFSQGIVEAHGGTLTLQPSRRGASFRIELPAAAETDIVAVPLDETIRIEPTQGGRALVVEDEPDVSDTLRELLEREGYLVTTAQDGAAALMAIDQDDFDLILSDLRMPGISGPEFYARLQETKPTLLSRIGFVTGDTLGSSMADFLRASARPVLEKPFTKMGVHCLVAELTRWKGQA